MRVYLLKFGLIVTVGTSIFFLSGCGQAKGASKLTDEIQSDQTKATIVRVSERDLEKSIPKGDEEKESQLKSHPVEIPVLPQQSPELLKLKREMAIRSAQSDDFLSIDKTIKITASIGEARKSPGSKEVLGKYKRNTTFNATREKRVNGENWYLVEDGPKKEWLSNEVTKVIPSPNVLLDAPLVLQLPELPRGCEVTALTMLIQQAGIETNKMQLAKQIKTIPFEKNDVKGNPYDGFVGNIYTFSKPGLGVYHGPIAKLAKKYLGNTVIDLSGENWDLVENQLDKSRAVWVITNVTFERLPKNDPNWYTWKTEDGPIRVTYKEHSVLVTGYGSSSVYVNDPLKGVKNLQLDKKAFIAAWKQMGSQAISYN